MKGPKCPHCGEYYEIEAGDDGDLITYYGSEGDSVELECQKCGKTFWVKEIVHRRYESALVPYREQWI